MASSPVWQFPEHILYLSRLQIYPDFGLVQYWPHRIEEIRGVFELENLSRHHSVCRCTCNERTKWTGTAGTAGCDDSLDLKVLDILPGAGLLSEKH